MSKRFQITVPDRVYDDWLAKADADGAPLASWVVLQVAQPDIPEAIDRMTSSADRMTRATADIQAATSATLDVLQQMAARMTEWDTEGEDV